MKVESSLLAELAEFIGNRSVRAVVDAAEGGAGAAVRDEAFLPLLQVLRSEALRGKEQEALDGAAVASSARRFLAALVVCCAEVDRLTRAVEERGGRGAAATEGDDDMDVDGDVGGAQDDMDVDGRPAAPGARHQRQEESGVAAGSAVAALFPSSGAKRKRASGGGEVDTAVRPHKRRRLLAWTRSHQWLPSGQPSQLRSRRARMVALARSRIRRPVGKPDARTVALASSRIQSRIGKPTTTRHRSKPSLGQHFSRITL